MVPASVTVAAGATSATFTVTTSAVSASTSATITGSFNGTQTATLTINPLALSTLTMSPTSVTGGTSSTGTVTLTGPAPAGGAVVTLLSSSTPAIPGIEEVSTPSGLPQDGSINWAVVGPAFTSVPSGTAVPVTGLPDLSMTFSTATGLSLQLLTQCPGVDCGWVGNFAPGAPLLWTGGSYAGDGSWTGNGPLTVTFNSPQRGLGFQIMADEAGPFTATLCAYNSGDTLLGCVPFSGNGTDAADNSAVFIGLYDDAQEISKVTIDAGGALYPHDFAIGNVLVASQQRQMVPASVTVAAGATSATFTVTSQAVPATTTSSISATMNGGTQTATLTVTP